MEMAATAPPAWRAERQFDFSEGRSTVEQRPNLLGDTAPKLLSDEQVRSFLANGYLTLRPDLPAEFHQELFERCALLNGAAHHARAGAVADIARLGASAASAAEALAGLLGDDNEAVGLNAEYALSHAGEAGIAPLVAALRGDDGENVDDARCFIDGGQKSELEMVARNATHDLVASGLLAVPALLECARDGGPRVRKYALFALGELDTDAPELIEVLVAGCRDEDPAVRLNAVEALERIGTTGANRALVRFLKIARWCPVTTTGNLF